MEDTIYVAAEDIEVPEGYKHKKCEACRNAKVQGIKNGLKAAIGTVGAVASIVLVVATKGKYNPKIRNFGGVVLMVKKYGYI